MTFLAGLRTQGDLQKLLFLIQKLHVFVLGWLISQSLVELAELWLFYNWLLSELVCEFMVSIDNVTQLPNVQLEYFFAERPEFLPFHAATVDIWWDFISFCLWIIDEIFEYLGEVKRTIYFNIC